MEIVLIRRIKPQDDKNLAVIIRQSLLDFNAAKPGTVYFDPTTDALFDLFQQPGSDYFVLEASGEVIGGGGIYPTPGLPDATCELVKFYLQKVHRGQGFGKLLLKHCETAAAALGYRNIYIETMPELTQALPLYEKAGYNYIGGSLGNSGHTGCTVFMMKQI